MERFSGLRSETEGRGPPVSLSAAQPAPANPPGRGGNPPTFMNSAGRGGNAPAPVTPPADGGSPQMPPAPQTGNTVTAAPPPSPRQAFEADKTTAFGARQGIQGRAMEDARKAAEQPQISRNYRGQLDGVAGNQAVPGNNDLTLKRLKELAGVPGQPKTPGELADIVRRRQAGSADPPGLPGAAGGAPAGGPATMPGLGATAPTGPGGFGGPGGPPAGLGGEPSRSKGAAGGAPPPAPGMGGRSGAAGGFGRAMPGPDRDADGFGKDAAKKLRLEKAEPMGEDRAARGPVTGPGGVPAGANPAGQPSKPGDEREMRRFAEQLKADEAPAYGMLGRFSALARRERGLEEKYKLLTPQSPPMSGGLAEAKPTGAAAKPEVAEKEAKDAKEGPAREAGLKLADAEKGPADEPKPEPTVPAPEPTRPVAPPISVHLGSMRPQWLTGADGSEVLVLVRAARLGETKTVYQGVVLDWPRLQEVLRDEVKDLFPAARLLPVKDPAGVSPERAMTALPVQLDPGPPPGLPPAGWTPLRLGLVLAWVAAVIAFAAVGLSGWSLIDLAERRIRFVSAVTHELRTPLTSLRLYLDLLLSGMVRDEAKRTEYLATLDAESDRLHRLIDNVLDFARLERRRTRANTQKVRVGELLETVRQTWVDRCGTDGKELVVISTLPAEQQVCTDAQLVGQIVGNLIDNARKYTREAADPRIWLWAKPAGRRWVVFEVEDRGPGVPPGERRAIFRPFRRGDAADTRAGGAGLGLALAKQWAEALGGRLSYRPADGGVGACFRLELRVR